MTVAIPTTPSAFEALAGLKAAGAAGERTGNKCWRDSYDVDDPRCRAFIHPVHAAERAAAIQATTEWNKRHKQAGQRMGPLRTHGVEVLRYIWQQAIKHAGLCCPSQADIAQACEIAISTVKETLNALELHGFLERQRRTVPVPGASGPEPHRQQTTNLYRLTLPKCVAWRARKLLLQAGKAVPKRGAILASIARSLTPEAIYARAKDLMAGREERQRRGRPAVALVLASLGRAMIVDSLRPPSPLSRMGKPKE